LRDTGHNLANLLASATKRAPDAAAVISRSGVTSWRELSDRSAGFAHALEETGAAPRDRVALFLERDAEAVAALFGAYAAGLVPVIVNPRLRPRQIEHVLDNAQVSVLVSSAEQLARQAPAWEPPVRLLDAGAVQPAGVLRIRPVAADALAQIVYTSGSSGQPKGVMFCNGALLSGTGTVSDYLRLHARDRVASLLSFSGVYGLNQMLTAVAVGATLVIETSPLAADIVAAMRTAQVTVLAAVPPLWLQLLAVREFEEPLPLLRVVQNAGGHLPVEAVRRLRTLQPQADLFLQYGMTETFRSTYLEPAEVDAHPGSLGRALPGAEILVIRPDGSPCATGETGELVHAGPTIASGYWNAPEATARTFRPHPAKPDVRAVFSGDLVRRDAEGRMYYVARHDHVINTLGFRVGPDEITDVLHASGQVFEAAVTARPDAERGQRIVAVVVLAPGGSVHALRRFCRQELPSYMQPAQFDVVESLPRLPSGKFDIGALGRPQG
jgi:acyl-CoA synthetase (AMP-forming)/AMP-acid ligase II